MVVVEAVGANPSEQASLSIEQSRATSAAEASVEVSAGEGSLAEFSSQVIAMSGKMGEDELKGLGATGFDGFLKKPFHVRQVIEAIEDAVAVVY